MLETITIRPYRRDDLQDVLELLRLTLGETRVLQRTPSLFAWKHLDNPFGRSIMIVAEDRGRIIGFRAFMRWVLEVPTGERVKCARPVDTATHPDYRRMGVFRRLTIEAVETAIADGVALLFNTPNPRSGAGYLSMGWDQVGGLPLLIRPSLRVLWRGSAPHSHELRGDPPQAELPLLQAWARSPLGLRTPRDAEYLEWRFLRHPTASYVVADDDGGRAVLRLNLRRGLRETVLSNVFGRFPRQAVNRLCKQAGSDYIVASFPANTPERSAIIRAGFIPVPRVNALTLYTRPLVDLPIDVTSAGSWDLALGDVELL